MRKSVLYAMTALLLFAVSSVACAQEKRTVKIGVKKPEQIANIVELANYTQANPQTERAVQYRKALLVYVMESPDVKVTLCALLKTGESDFGTYMFGETITGQLVYVAQSGNPYPKETSLAEQSAGIEFALKTYANARKASDTPSIPDLEELSKLSPEARAAEIKKRYDDSGCGKPAKGQTVRT